MSRKRLAPQLLIVLVLAVGVAIVWGLVAAFLTSTWENQIARGQTLYENLQVTSEGQPLITGYLYGASTYQQQPTRTLDGKIVEDEPFDVLRSADLPAVARRLQWYDGPRTWNDRLLSTSDMQRSPVTWYLIRDEFETGLAYLAGYDQGSRLCVGYMGRQGFRGSPPPVEQQFVTGPGRWFNSGAGRVVGGYLNNVYYTADVNRSDDGVALWRLYLIDEDRVLEIDTRERSVRTILTSPKIVSLGILTRPSDPADAKPARRVQPTVAMLAVRLEDAVAVIDPSRDEQIDFPLPENLRHADSVSFYQLNDERALVDVGAPGPTGYVHHLTWITKGEADVEQKSLELAGYVPASERRSAVIGSLVAPLPVVTAATALGFIPVTKLVMHRAPSYGEAVRDTIEQCWPAGVGVLVAAIAATWLAWRWHRQSDRPSTAAWMTTVFLLGPAGLIAYLLHHGRAHTTACERCGQVVPQRRHACAACGEEFAAPQLTGLEVFA